MARKPKSFSVAQLLVMIQIDSQLDPVGISDVMQNSQSESQNEIKYAMDTT
jgi:hypothetical protein